MTKAAVLPSSQQEAALLHPLHVAGGRKSRMETVSAAHLTASALAMQPESGQNCAAKRTAARRSETQTRMCSHPVISLFSDYVETYVRPLLLLFLQSRPETYPAHWAYLAAKNRPARALSPAEVITRAILIFSSFLSC